MLSIVTYQDEDEAARIANGTPYGLAGAVWAGSDARAIAFARRLRTGQVDINGGAFNALAPFGGYKQSGNGRELGKYGLEEFLEYKAVSRESRAPGRQAAPARARSNSTTSTSSRVVCGLTKQKRRTVSPACLVGISMATPRASASAHHAA